jgi:tetratricopeptide (TPR) repeat protein
MDNDLYKIFEKTYFNHKYYLKEFKGAGAFGAVFLADEVVGGTKIQEVAIKAIRKDKMPSDIIAKELVTAIRLKHPNLINCITSEEGRLKHSVFDYECFGLVMEIASGTLEDYLQASRVLPVSEVREIVEAIASGLVYLHGQSVTHRDLKPANVLRVGNVWKISDFGIARQMGRESGTMTTSLTGTPIYMPPEVYAASSEDTPMKVSPAWDIWSLGVMIVEMLTGELPFDGVTDIWKMNIKIKGFLHEPFDEIVQNCLRKKPKQRWTAKQILEKNLDFKQKSADDYCDFALEKFLKDDYRGAIDDYTEAIRIEPNDAYVYYTRAGARDGLGDKKGAISDYDEAIRISSKFICAYYRRADMKSQLGDYKGAISDYNEIIRIHSDDASAYSLRGIMKQKLDDIQGAISDYNEAIHLQPDDASNYHIRGCIRSQVGDRGGAISDFNEAIHIDPNYPFAYYSLGCAKSQVGDKEGAISNFDKAIQLQPNYANAYYNRGLLKSDLGDRQGAIKDYSVVIGLDPKSVDSYFNRGLEKEKLGDKEGTVSDFTEAIRLNPHDADLYYNRGCFKSALGDREGSICDYNEAIRLNPSDADYYHNRGIVKSSLGDEKGAISDYNEAMRLKSESSEQCPFSIHPKHHHRTR